ncbi:DNA adenine methylase [Enterococcus durans]|uniref:DNA adenine methylase n=1 Tax=Enterococcus durans TaxID=53345 RepID=UPI00232AE1DD|nr:DNA adenine methylase [Enterococcus durans]MDB1652817.1 DNA adenine methylase [Enterococcus durans]MDB1656281.1 DNA adenine methylase [Enterococcus durans]MDB1664665.1 DNA adenine methylase [Enterococcus durans]MDB1668681.1 DNA adenine methylase [Enterococcus durans]MDB1671412.1 DNA adenine methylase [Enterococcus durans]
MNFFKVEYSAKYPKVNYIGNKEKIASWIVDHLPVTEGSVLDIFSGGNSLSYELKKQNFKVISNDILYSSYVVSKALIENSKTQLKEQHIDEATKIQLTSEDKNAYNWLGNTLFFPEEIDELTKLIKYSKSLESYEKYIFQALIRRAMIRKLPYSRMNIPWNNIVKLRDEEYSYQKYGRKRAYHNKTFIYHMKKNLQDYNLAVFDNNKENLSYQEDAKDILDIIDHVDIIYMDPPYPSTMNKYDEFYGTFDKLFKEQKNHIDLTNKELFSENLEILLQKALLKTDYIVMSLNSNSKPGVEEIKKLFSKYGSVSIEEKKHNYQVSGKNNKNNNYELLVILKVIN